MSREGPSLGLEARSGPGRRPATADFASTFLAPQHLAGLLAVVLVASRHRSAARVAAVVAWVDIAAFTFFHGIPVEVGPSKPYWGDGTGGRVTASRGPA